VRSRPFLLFSTIAVLYSFIQNSVGNWIVLHLTEEKHFPLGVASLGLSLFWCAMALGRVWTSVLVLRVAPEKVWMTLPCLMAVVLMMFHWMQSIPMSLTVCFLIGLACSSFFPLAISIGTTMFERNKGWFSSMAFIVLTIGGGFSSLLIGTIRDSVPLSSIFTASAGMSVIIFILVTVFLNQTGKKSAVSETSSERIAR
jgi:MFS transporter, FHS family, glucose/mannose:H+ symporter